MLGSALRLPRDERTLAGYPPPAACRPVIEPEVAQCRRLLANDAPLSDRWFPQPPPFLYLIPNYLFLLLVGYGESTKILANRYGESTWKTPRNHTELWKRKTPRPTG